MGGWFSVPQACRKRHPAAVQRLRSCAQRLPAWRHPAGGAFPSRAQGSARSAQQATPPACDHRAVIPPAFLPPVRAPGAAGRLHALAATLASLPLMLVLLGLGGVLVLAATLDQVNLGIWAVQEKYFRSLVVFTRIGPVTVPLFPGGYAIGGLLLLNLAAAFVTRFAWTWRKSGLLLAHLGLVLLLIGELASGLWQRDFSLRLAEGETRAFAESAREFELALIDGTAPEHDDIVTVPGARVAARAPLQHPRLPFRVAVRAYYPNSSLHNRGAEDPNLATQGIGLAVAAAPRPPTANPREENAPAAYVELTGAAGPLGIWLVSPLLAAPQDFAHEGRTWRIALRPRRLPLPHSLTLLKFTHDRYPGTGIPRDFSSRLLLRESGAEEGREVLISMNAPLRHGGLAHFQAGFADNDRTSILQVVRNPAWAVPYIACTLMAAGLLLQFSQHLVRHIARRREALPAGANPVRSRHDLPRAAAVMLIVSVALVAFTLRPPAESGPFDLRGFGRLPALLNGRVKPLDTVARTSLLLTQGRQRVTDAEGRGISPTEWLLDVLHQPERADLAPVFEVTHPELLALLQLNPATGAGGKRFSLGQLRPQLGEADRQARLAEAVEPAMRTTFQNAVIRLRQAVALHQGMRLSARAPGEETLLDRLSRTGASGEGLDPREAERLSRALGVTAEFASLHLTPPAPGDPPAAWRKLPVAWRDGLAAGTMDPAARAHAELGRAWRAANAAAFNAAIRELQAITAQRVPPVPRRMEVETRFNAAQPFLTSMVLFMAAFLAAVVSWLRWPGTLGRVALGLLTLAFALTTAGVAARMWLESRPPVTNLYSSALFVGWGAVAICLVLEMAHRRALAAAAGGLVGFGTMLIAHHLALDGDTLEMMRAVLDSNFWLATHVVTITAGYSATFLAGFLSLVHIGRAVATRGLDAPTADALARMTYGVTCFALLFNVTGTVLGGIWADQSWGRFWGWDPKENGALLIVLWNAITLHARAAGLARQRGLAVLAVLGNVVTAWSWFGVNMLGVGLHSYGFMGAAFWWLLAFAVSQVIVAACAALPSPVWGRVPAPQPARLPEAAAGTPSIKA
ncbi:MAG: hypothetical protein RIR76_2239 [Verrucomicrobiota bacterium]